MTVERTRECIAALEASAESRRKFAALCIGATAVSVFCAALEFGVGAGKEVGLTLFAAASGVWGSAALALAAYQGLVGVAQSQEAAALEGALMSHELAIAAMSQEVPFDQDV